MNFDIVEVVIDKLVRTFRLREWQYDIEELVEDLAEGLKLIGAARQFEVATAKLVVNGRIAKLPRNCENIMHLIPTSMQYQESGSYIEVDEADGTEIYIQYQSIPLDTRGYPLIPDNAPTREALMWYMVKTLILQGEIKNVGMQYAEAEWQWRCSSARADLNAMSLQQVNQVHTNFVRLNPLKDQHLKGYVGLSKPNTLYRDKFKDISSL